MSGPSPEPRIIVAAPLHERLDTVYFEYQTVSQERLEETWRSADSSRNPGLHWRLSYHRPAPPSLTDETARALSVVDKILCRGHVTLLSQELEEALVGGGRHSGRKRMAGPSAGEPELDSDAERAFWHRFLPSVMGDGFRAWVTPQVEIASLTASADFASTEQRVDFLIAHPDLAPPIVVEIDGEQHVAKERMTRPVQRIWSMGATR